MHRYQPVVHLQEIGPDVLHSSSSSLPPLESLFDPERSVQFAFPETAFTTVTAYQNQQVTHAREPNPEVPKNCPTFN